MNKNTNSEKSYDLNPIEKEIADWKVKRRLYLRNEYLHEIHSPNAVQKGHIFDEQLQRQFTTNLVLNNFFKPSTKNFIWFFTITFGFSAVVASRIKKFRDKKEHGFRTGQVSYRDRDWKFV